MLGHFLEFSVINWRLQCKQFHTKLSTETIGGKPIHLQKILIIIYTYTFTKLISTHFAHAKYYSISTKSRICVKNINILAYI